MELTPVARFQGCPVATVRECFYNTNTRSPNLFVSTLLIGAGAFNLVEGLIDHHLLGIHHVKSGAY